MSFIVFHYDTQATSTFHLTRNLNISLPAANEVCEGYVFTRICHSVHRGWRAWQGGGVRGGGGHAWQGGCVARGHAPPHQILQDTVIRSMSGWYASYWNAFLLKYTESFLHFGEMHIAAPEEMFLPIKELKCF